MLQFIIAPFFGTGIINSVLHSFEIFLYIPDYSKYVCVWNSSPPSLISVAVILPVPAAYFLILLLLFPLFPYYGSSVIISVSSSSELRCRYFRFHFYHVPRIVSQSICSSSIPSWCHLLYSFSTHAIKLYNMLSLLLRLRSFSICFIFVSTHSCNYVKI